MKIEFTFDEKGRTAEMQDKIQKEYKQACQNAIHKFFERREYHEWDNSSPTKKTKLTITEGDGYKVIQNFVADKFLSDEMQSMMESFFQDNWQRIFEECMTRAIQHKANAVVFNKQI